MKVFVSLDEDQYQHRSQLVDQCLILKLIRIAWLTNHDGKS